MLKPLDPPQSLGIISAEGPRMTCSYRVSHHGRAGDGAEHRNWVHGPRPVRATEVIAGVLAEERADAVGTQIRHAVVAIARQDDGVGEDDFLLVDASL